MSAVLIWRSKTIRGRMVAMTVRSTAPRKTAARAATRAQRRSASRARGIDLDVGVMVEEIEGPDHGFVGTLCRGFGQPGADEIVRLLVDPEIDGDRRALQSVVGEIA